MKKHLSMSIFTLGILLFFAVPSHAIVEVRAHYGAGQGSPDQYNDAYFKLQDGPELKEQKALGADVLFSLPMLPVGFGARIEGMQEKDTAFNEEVEVDMLRTSILLNYRLVNTLMYAGPIVTIGVGHDFEMLIPTGPDRIKSSDGKSFTVGVEGGVKLGLFSLGAELGYQSLKFTDFTEADGSVWTKNSQTLTEFDLSGMYYKILFGFGF